MGRRLLTWGSWSVGLVVVLLWLSWVDILPGGWTLRGWVEPHAQRAERARLEYEAERREQFQQQRAQSKAGSIFLGGSSTIERFPYEWFAPGHLLNRGINDEPSPHFAARWESSLPSAPIGGAVLYLASVDFRRWLSTPQEVEERIHSILGAWRERFPELPILVLGIYPEQDMPAGWAERLAATNAVIAQACEHWGVQHLDLNRPPLVEASGDLAPAYAADPWHMNQAGYQQALRWLQEQDPAWLARLRPRPDGPAAWALSK